MTHKVVRYSALRGSWSVGWTLAKNLEAGRPPSRAKAYVMRLLVVIIEVVAKRRQTSGKLFDIQRRITSLKETCWLYINMMMEPGLLLVAWKKIWSRGPAADSITSSMGPATSSRTVRKMNPVKVPMPTQAIMIFGPSTEALGISGRSQNGAEEGVVFRTFNHVRHGILSIST